jgi:hypothetical protein
MHVLNIFFSNYKYINLIMFAIELLFQSDVKDIYTMWRETSDNEFFFHVKLDRMLNRWLRLVVDEQVVVRTNIEYEN